MGVAKDGGSGSFVEIGNVLVAVVETPLIILLGGPKPPSLLVLLDFGSRDFTPMVEGI